MQCRLVWGQPPCFDDRRPPAALALRRTLVPRAFLTATVMMSPMVHCVPDFWMHCTSLAPELSDTCSASAAYIDNQALNAHRKSHATCDAPLLHEQVGVRTSRLVPATIIDSPQPLLCCSP
jgi:hypothetical protein